MIQPHSTSNRKLYCTTALSHACMHNSEGVCKDLELHSLLEVMDPAIISIYKVSIQTTANYKRNSPFSLTATYGPAMHRCSHLHIHDYDCNEMTNPQRSRSSWKADTFLQQSSTENTYLLLTDTRHPVWSHCQRQTQPVDSVTSPTTEPGNTKQDVKHGRSARHRSAEQQKSRCKFHRVRRCVSTVLNEWSKNYL